MQPSITLIPQTHITFDNICVYYVVYDFGQNRTTIRIRPYYTGTLYRGYFLMNFLPKILTNKKLLGKKITIELHKVEDDNDNGMENFIQHYAEILNGIQYYDVKNKEIVITDQAITNKFNMILETERERQNQEILITKLNSETYTTTKLTFSDAIKKAIILMAKNLQIMSKNGQQPALRELTLNISHLPAATACADAEYKNAFSLILGTIYKLTFLDTRFDEQSSSSLSTLFDLMNELDVNCRLKNLALITTSADRAFDLTDEESKKLVCYLHLFNSITLNNIFFKTPEYLQVYLTMQDKDFSFYSYVLSILKYEKNLTLEITGFNPQLNLFDCVGKICSTLKLCGDYSITLKLGSSTLNEPNGQPIPHGPANLQTSSYPNVVVLRMCNITWDPKTLNDLALILKNSPNIRSLYLDGGKFDSRDVAILQKAIAESVAKLSILSLDITSLNNDEKFAVTETAFAKNVTTVSLKDTKNITRANLITALNAIKNCKSKTTSNQRLEIDLGEGCTFEDNALTYLKTIIITMQSFPFNLLVDVEYRTGEIKEFIEYVERLNRPDVRRTLQESLPITDETNQVTLSSSPMCVSESKGEAACEESAAKQLTSNEVIQLYERHIKAKLEKGKNVDDLRQTLISTLIKFYNMKLILDKSFVVLRMQQHVIEIKSDQIRIAMYDMILSFVEMNFKDSPFPDVVKVLTSIYKDKKLTNWNLLTRCEKLLLPYFKEIILRQLSNSAPQQGLFSEMMNRLNPQIPGYLYVMIERAGCLDDLADKLKTLIDQVSSPIKENLQSILKTISSLPEREPLSSFDETDFDPDYTCTPGNTADDPSQPSAPPLPNPSGTQDSSAAAYFTPDDQGQSSTQTCPTNPSAPPIDDQQDHSTVANLSTS